ncbi:NACHT domain-containing protein [Micromonospora costi]|uniref:NACHT domain-containing protein n=1 Tax=Micromonospora costi TaxID=1530042 RepID=UPI0011C3A892|nr:hypothetical protein [Micromonospora costi]
MSSTAESATPIGAIGGASGDAGVEYRRAVAAYAVAHGLAGAALIGFGVPPAVAFVQAVALETDDVVDDVGIEFQSGWRATVQAKRTLRKGKPFSSAIAQWRLAAQRGIQENERLVLVTSQMPKWAYDLKRLLDRHKLDKPGSPTHEERDALKYLDAELSGLTASQRKSLLKCASIHVLSLEEEEQQDSRQAIRLLDGVVGREASLNAWRDLVSLAGKTARLRGGFLLHGWLDLLTVGGYRVLTSEGTAAARMTKQEGARQKYRTALRNRGSMVDLRPLGATTPPIPLAKVDAKIEAIAPGEDGRDSRDLLWAFIRRGRMVLTGLPGGGKSLALSVLAARLLDIQEAPFPVLASLKDVDRQDQSLGFRDRLLKVALRDLPADSRPLIQEELEARFEEGRVALLLDALDETHGRRAQVVSELDEFVCGLSPDVDVLLATRDVSYGHASSLGWEDLRLAPPKEIEKTVRAILETQASASNPAKDEDWVRTRERWVTGTLNKDRSLRETPLMPILLSLLAATKSDDTLPTHRASILYAAVTGFVDRQEARLGNALQMGPLAGRSASKALLDGFAVEARRIATAGGQCTFGQVLHEIEGCLVDRWGLTQGPAEVAAEAIARFWDEAGIFVISGGDEKVAPRVELFLEIGEAVHISTRPEQEVVEWIAEVVQAGRHEPLILAAGLSELVARELLREAARSRNHALLLAAITAIRQGAAAVEPEFGSLFRVLLEDTGRGDAEAWQLWSRTLELAKGNEQSDALLDALESFPEDYRTIGRTTLLLRGKMVISTADRDGLLLDTLKVSGLSPLPQRDTAQKGRFATIDGLYSRAIEGAAEELLGRRQEATELVVRALDHSSMGMHDRLCKLLRARGFEDIANEIESERWSGFSKSFARLADLDRHAHLRLLKDLAKSPGSELTYQQATRLAELGSLCETLNLNQINAWPDFNDYDQWFWPLVQLVMRLGQFDTEVISAQASLTLDRIATAGSDDAFFYIFDDAEPRPLQAWDSIEDQEGAVRFLASMFFLGVGTAWVAARALWRVPVADLAVPLLREVLRKLRTPERQRIVAVALLSLVGNEILVEWAMDPSPVLRRIAAEFLPLPQDGSIPPEMTTLLRDPDGNVVECAVERLERRDNPQVQSELARISQQPNPGWKCLHCGTENPAGRRSCIDCRTVGPDPAALATSILHGTPKPVRVMLDLDNWDD